MCSPSFLLAGVVCPEPYNRPAFVCPGPNSRSPVVLAAGKHQGTTAITGLIACTTFAALPNANHCRHDAPVNLRRSVLAM